MKNILLAFVLSILSACGSSEEPSAEASPQVNTAAFPVLPADDTERVVLEGIMTFWMVEGAAGCYGSISDGVKEVQLWVNASACEKVEYAEDVKAKVEVTFNQEEQFGPGDTYTIVNFL